MTQPTTCAARCGDELAGGPLEPATSGAGDRSPVGAVALSRPDCRAVVVVPGAGHDALLACLRSVEAAQTHNRTPFRLVLVDGGGDPAARALMDAVTGGVEVLDAGAGGLAAALERVAAGAAPDPVVLLDPATSVRGGWLDALLAGLAPEAADAPGDAPSAPGAVLVPARGTAAGGEGGPGVLLVPNAYAPSSRGGVETHVALLAAALQRRGERVLVLHPHRDPGRPDYEVQRDLVEGVPVVRVNRPVNLWHQEHGDERFERLFRDLLHQERIDVVHFHHLCDGLSPSLVEVARGAGAATAVTLHDGYTTCAKGHAVDADGRPCSGATSVDKCTGCVLRSTGEAGAATRITLRNRAMEACLRRADLVTAPSRYVAALTAAAPWAADLDVRVRPLGVDLDALGAGCAPAAPRAAGERLRVVVLGNVRTHPSGTDTKGGRLLAAAARALPHVDVDVHGSTDAALGAAMAGIPNLRVHGPYHPSQRGDLLRGAHCLVIASPVESFSCVAREALAVGLPVVSSDGGALPEAVRDGVDGLLFRAGDARSLVAVLARLEGDDALRLRLAGSRPVLLGVEEDAAAWSTTYRELRGGRAEEPPRPAPPGPAVSVVVAATGAARQRCLAALREQSLPPADVEVVLADPAATGQDAADDPLAEPAWAAAVRRATAPVVLVLDGTLVPGPRLLAEHLAGHAAAPGGTTAVVGPTAAALEVLHDPAARAWLRRAGADRDGAGLVDGAVVEASWASLGRASFPRALLLDLVAEGSCTDPAVLAAALSSRAVAVRYRRWAVLHALGAPDAAARTAQARDAGRRQSALAAQAPWAAALLEVDDLPGRLEHVAGQVALAEQVVARLAAAPPSHLRAGTARVGDEEVPADVLLDAALGVLAERDRLHGAAGARAVTRVG